jgi:hypothetical protein
LEVKVLRSPDKGKSQLNGKGVVGDANLKEAEGKGWPNEQEADTRPRSGVRCPKSSWPETCTERYEVDPTGISVKVSVPYPGRSARVWMPWATRPESKVDKLGQAVE